MLCPNCEKHSLKRHEIEPKLTGLSCEKCQGEWLNTFQYLLWKDIQEESQKISSEHVSIDTNDVQKIKHCPECNILMSRYKVGKDLNFTIDRCETCRGVWFDKQEWEAIKSKNLHTQIHFIFSDWWQKQIREEEVESSRSKRLTKLLGEDGFEKLASFKEWLLSQKGQKEALGYLNIHIR